jgi:hypothetical protein
MAGVFGGAPVTEATRAIPEWCLKHNAQPDIKIEPDEDATRLIYGVGVVCINWTSLESALQTLSDCLLGAHDLDRPNSKPIADAVYASQTNIKAKCSLIETLCAIVLIRQPNLRKQVFDLLTDVEALSSHRNGIVHGCLINRQFNFEDGSYIKKVMVGAAMPKELHRAFARSKDPKRPDSSRVRQMQYDFSAVEEVALTITAIEKKLFEITIHPYLQALGRREEKPSQGDVGF